LSITKKGLFDVTKALVVASEVNGAPGKPWMTRGKVCLRQTKVGRRLCRLPPFGVCVSVQSRLSRKPSGTRAAWTWVMPSGSAL
jgi:hypothetical protein